MKKAVIAVLGIWLFFVGVMAYTAANAQDIPLIEGTIHLYMPDGTVEGIVSDKPFVSVVACYEAGIPVAANFMVMSGAVGVLVTCEPAGDDV